MSSFEPGQGADQMETGAEILGGLLVARGDASELFDKLEEAFDEIALSIQGEIAFSFGFAIGLGRNNHFDLAPFEAGDEAIRVVAFVSQDGLRLHLGDKRLGLSDVVNLPAGQAQRQRIAQGVDDDMNFGRQAAARAAYGLVETPFFRAPALC